ncbi:MAG: acyltransferase family protein [Steroidobacteraceae bacterium]
MLPNRHAKIQLLARPARVEVAARRAREGGIALTYRPDIDGLRGLAVGLVVAYHAFPRFRSGGFVGVDVFFVISGYLITLLVLSGLQTGTFSLIEFYRRRVRRIVPALLVVVIACCIFGWLLLLPSELRALGSSIKWCALFLANLFFAQTGGYFDPVAESNPLLHLWSLGVEEQFYLVWPVLLTLAVRRGVTMRVLGTLVAASLGLSIWSAWIGPTPHFYNPATRAWELAVGGMLAAWQFGTPRKPAADDSLSHPPRWLGAQAISLVGLALIILGGLCWTADRRIPGIWSVIPAVGAVLLIAAGPSATANRWFLASRPMTFIGRISYPLYLWHWPLFSFTRIVLGHPAQPAMAAGAIVIAVAAAYATYRLVEAPIRYGNLGRKAVPALLAGLALLAVAGVALEARWITGRLSGPIVSQWDSAANDWHFSGDNRIDERTGFGTLTVSSRRNRKALFIGDSHIQQYWPRVRRLIDAHPDSARSAVFVSFPAWPPLPGINRLYHRTKSSGFFNRAIELASQPDVDTVVIGAFWEFYFLGEYPPDRYVQEVYGVPLLARAPLQLDSPSTQAAFEQFQRAISRLTSSRRRVFIILSNPTSPLFEPVFPTEIRLSLHLPSSLRSDEVPRIDAGPFESFAAPVMNRLRAIAAQTGAKVVDPRLTLCEGMICSARDSKGMPLYLDSNHLNGSNARERASFVDEMVLGPDVELNDPLP